MKQMPQAPNFEDVDGLASEVSVSEAIDAIAAQVDGVLYFWVDDDFGGMMNVPSGRLDQKSSALKRVMSVYLTHIQGRVKACWKKDDKSLLVHIKASSE